MTDEFLSVRGGWKVVVRQYKDAEFHSGRGEDGRDVN